VPTVDCRGGGFDADMGDGNDTVIVSGTRMGIRNVLDGGVGDDRFVGGLGAETFIGGGGDDTVDYGARPPGSVTVDVGGGPQSGAHGEHDDIHTDVEHVLLP
jgi:Ca2+-binding RTX toxin-like protein